MRAEKEEHERLRLASKPSRSSKRTSSSNTRLDTDSLSDIDTVSAIPESGEAVEQAARMEPHPGVSGEEEDYPQELSRVRWS